MLQPLLGGVIIGVAATLLLACCGKLAGNSGMIHGLLPPQPGDWEWRALYLLGLVAGAALYGRFQPDAAAAAAARAAHPLAVVAGGMIVGFGTRLGAGCTSGHSVCGIARLSPRSIVATIVFIAVGMLTATLMRAMLP